MADDLNPEMEKILEKIQKLLNLSAKAGTPEEAASAAAKAQELLTAYNLDAAMLERTSGKTSGKREDAKLNGGFYHFQRSLWSSVAKLNFCLYWTQEVQRTEADGPARINRHGKVIRTKFVHRIVGRTVNIAATRAMGTYLEEAIDRILTNRMQGAYEAEHFYGNYAMSFREGAVSNLCSRIYERRRELLAEEQRRQQAEDAARSGNVDTSNALTLAVYVNKETDANLDFLYGEGYSAKRAAERSRQAAAAKAAEEEYTKWAAAHPEEAKAEEEKRRKEEEKLSRKYRSRSNSRDRKIDWYAYDSGYAAAKNISLDQQVASPTAGLIEGGK